MSLTLRRVGSDRASGIERLGKIELSEISIGMFWLVQPSCRRGSIPLQPIDDGRHVACLVVLGTKPISPERSTEEMQ